MFGILSKLFHEQTRAAFERHIAPVLRQNPTHWPDIKRNIPFKEYARMPVVVLPPPSPLHASLREVLEARCSTREFDAEHISLQTLASLLHHAAGIKCQPSSTESRAWHTTTRFYPSAGARYPLELYIYANRIENLKRGLYHYNVKRHVLTRLLGVESKVELQKYVFASEAFQASCIIFISAVWDRTFRRYQDFGYRLVLMEAGHVAQNVQLVGGALGLVSFPFVNFSNNELEKVLGFAPHVESTLYAVAVGISAE